MATDLQTGPDARPRPAAVPTALAAAGEGASTEVTFPVTGMTCASCVRRIERRLGKVEGVARGQRQPRHREGARRLRPERWSPSPDLVAAVEKAGYGVGRASGRSGTGAPALSTLAGRRRGAIRLSPMPSPQAARGALCAPRPLRRERGWGRGPPAAGKAATQIARQREIDDLKRKSLVSLAVGAGDDGADVPAARRRHGRCWRRCC